MSTRRTTLHLPVRYTLAPGADETRYLRTLADQAADRIEAAGSAAATIEAGEPAIDPPAGDRPAPAVRYTAGDRVLIPGTLLGTSHDPDGAPLWHVQLDGPRDHVAQVPESAVARPHAEAGR